MYLSFVRSIIKYADIAFVNCTQYEKDELDKTYNEAAKIVSASTKLVSLRALHKAVSWEPLDKRRTDLKLIMFYKMNNGLTPKYRSSLVPPAVGETSTFYHHFTISSSRTGIISQ